MQVNVCEFLRNDSTGNVFTVDEGLCLVVYEESDGTYVNHLCFAVL